MEGFGHGEDGKPVPVTDFDYGELDNFAGDSDLSELTQEDIDRGVKVVRVLLEWIWQNGMKNADGLKIRAILVCWIFLKELRPMQLTEVAIGFGQKKQSLGRWHDHFKKCFPRIRTPHMR